MAAALLFGVALASSAVLLQILKSRNEQLWNDLGQPRLLNLDSGSSAALLRYLLSKEYRKLPDKVLVGAFEVARVIQLAVFVCIAFFCLIMVVQIVRNFKGS